MLRFAAALLLCCTGSAFAGGEVEVPWLEKPPAGAQDTLAGRLVYLPDDLRPAQQLLHGWNRAVAAGAADPAEWRIPRLEELYGAAAELPSSPWASPEGRALYGGGEEERRELRQGLVFDLRHRRDLPGVLLLAAPSELAPRLQAFVDSAWLERGYDHAPRPAPPVTGSFEADRALRELAANSGLAQIEWKNYLMILVGLGLLYLGIAKGFEPLLLVPIATGCILVNAVGANMAGSPGTEAAGLLGYFYEYGIKTGIFPLLIFLGVGALTDFGPLLANPSTALLGAAAQLGIFGTFFVAAWLIPWFDMREAAAIAIIGGADGPTSIYVASKLAPHLLGAIAVAAYSYMALVPIIQPPIMRALTTEAERTVIMRQLKPVSKQAKIAFPIAVTLLCILTLPDAVPLVGMLMFGNLLRESGVTQRLAKASQNEIINVTTILLGTAVGTKLSAEAFLNLRTLAIVVLGCAAFCLGTAGGVLFGKLMYVLSKGKINPLIGAAGVSAVPMAARVAQTVGQQCNPRNFLLMHAMGPNVAGVIGSAVAAGILLALLK